MSSNNKKLAKLAKGTLACTLSAAMALTAINVAPMQVKAAGNYNYGDALSKSLLFYQLQESGKLSKETLSRTNWRADSCLKDGQDNNIDLTGGWYDAGDNVKFNLPMAYSSMILAWSYLNNPTAYTKSGQEKWLLHDIKWANDYFVKCNPNSSTYYYQVGDGNADHSFWGAPEVVEEKMDRPSYKVDDSSANGGSCVTGEAAASLAAASIVLKSSDPSRSATYLEHAKTLYGMAERAKSDAGYTEADSFYHSWSGFYDELSLAACWLYKATGDEEWLEKAEKYAKEFGKEFQGDEDTIAYSWTMAWDDVHMGAELLLAELTGKEEYYTPIENSIDCYNGKITGSNPINISSGGLAVLSNWGSIRYACNQAFINVIYSGLEKADPTHVKEGLAYVERTANYVLGSSGRNFMVGYNSESPKNPHHRAAHGCWDNNMSADPKVSRHTLVGAVVGGPASADDSDYEDVRSNYQTNEVACDYNAGFTGIAAYMYEKNGYGAVKDASAIETPDNDEFIVQAGINAQDKNNKVNYVELKVVVRNHTAWPARVTDNLKLRLYFDLSDTDPAGMSISTTYRQYPVSISKFQKTSVDGIYYFDVDLSQARIYPGGQSEHRCELQLRVTAPGKWDYSKSPAVVSAGGTSSSEMKSAAGVALYEGSKLVYGEEYKGSSTPIVPTTVAPTTVAPTTVAPTTVAPTTVAPTTVAPTTVAPTTVAPTTVEPTTVVPTTVEPTTVVPVNGDVTATAVVNNWDAGYQVQIKVANNTANTVDGWTLKLNKKDLKIGDSWNVNVKEEAGYYVITPVEWNKTIAPGKSIEFGIQGSGNVDKNLAIIVNGKTVETPTEEPTKEEPTVEPTTEAPTTEEPTVDPEAKVVTIKDVKLDKEVDLSKYDFANVKSVVVTFKGDATGFGGAVVLGNWAQQTDFNNSMVVNKKLKVAVVTPASTITIRKWWSNSTLEVESIDLIF